MCMLCVTGDLCGSEVLQLGRDLGVEDKEGIRVTQVRAHLHKLVGLGHTGTSAPTWTRRSGSLIKQLQFTVVTVQI